MIFREGRAAVKIRLSVPAFFCVGIFSVGCVAESTENVFEKTVSSVQESGELDFIEQNGQKFIHVSTIGTVEANRQFIQNVNLVNLQRQQIAQLDESRKVVSSSATREALTKEIEAAVKKLEENNATMAKSYGYSLARKYIHAIIKTRVFIKLTDEEYENAREDPETKFADLLVKDDEKYRLIAVIPGVEENNNFRRNVQLVQEQRNQLVQMKQELASATGEQKTKLEEEIKKVEEVLLKNNEEMIKRYGFSLARDYLMEVEESKLYTQVNEEEFRNAQKAAEKAYFADSERKNIEKKPIVAASQPAKEAQLPASGNYSTPRVISPLRERTESDVDSNIPKNRLRGEDEIFVLVIANEDYSESGGEVSDVPCALNDGEVFAKYAKMTLGVPEQNVFFEPNARLSVMRTRIREFAEYGRRFPGSELILYYAGHGVSAEDKKDVFLLPTNVSGKDAEYDGISVSGLFADLSRTNASQIAVFLDACYSGDGSRRVSQRIAPTAPRGNMMVFSASNAVAMPLPGKRHGIFTYVLLKKLQETKGKISWRELGTHLSERVPQEALRCRIRCQEPSWRVSDELEAKGVPDCLIVR